MGTLIFNKTLRLDCLPCAPPYSEDIPAAADGETQINDSGVAADENRPLLAAEQTTAGGTFDENIAAPVEVEA